MLDDSIRTAIALKRFSLIGPILNGLADNQAKYFSEVCANPIEMPHYGLRNYSPKTLSVWVDDYRRFGIDGLKPGYRNDIGKSRKINNEVAEKIFEERKNNMQLPLST